MEIKYTGPLAREAAMRAQAEEFYNQCHDEATGHFCEQHFESPEINLKDRLPGLQRNSVHSAEEVLGAVSRLVGPSGTGPISHLMLSKQLGYSSRYRRQAIVHVIKNLVDAGLIKVHQQYDPHAVYLSPHTTKRTSPQSHERIKDEANIYTILDPQYHLKRKVRTVSQ